MLFVCLNFNLCRDGSIQATLNLSEKCLYFAYCGVFNLFPSAVAFFTRRGLMTCIIHSDVA